MLKGPTENGVFGVERVPGGKSFAPDNPRGPGAPRESDSCAKSPFERQGSSPWLSRSLSIGLARLQYGKNLICT